MKIEIYCDGSCRGNPGPGGWGVVILYNDKQLTYADQLNYTTNQQMELIAAIEGLDRVDYYIKVENFDNIILYTDSAYLYNCWKDEWWKKWEWNGWKNSKKDPVANKELWEKLIPWFRQINFSIVKVKGHASNKFNNLADLLATGQIQPTDA